MIMKQNILTASAAAAIFAGNFAGSAAPLNPKDVAAEPAWVVHVDVDALRNTAVAKTILSQPEIQDKLAGFGALFDFDVRTQLHGVSLYATKEHIKDGTVIVYADFDGKRLLTLAKGMAQDFHTVTNGSHTIYCWNDDKHKDKGGEEKKYGAIEGNRVIVSSDGTQLANALDVIEGKAQTFSEKGLPQSEDGESIIASALLMKTDFDNEDDNAAILKLSKTVSAKIGEKGDKMIAHVKFEAADEETAKQIAAIAQGLIAFGQLMKPNESLTKLANSIVLKQDGSTVGVTLPVATADLLKMVKDGQEKEKAKEKEKVERKAHSDSTNNSASDSK